MGKNKLSKFAEMESFSNVLQVAYRQIGNDDHPIKGNWNKDFFKNEQPIILELGCGKGEYTVDLAAAYPEKNYIGIDIKGARIWKGAKDALQKGYKNAGFLRTHIEMVDQFFAPGEVDEIWLTFPDPQMKKTRKRLTSTRFIELYRKFLKPGGIVHLKTDSNFQYQYTMEVIKINDFKVLEHIDDVHGDIQKADILGIKTYYEKQWLSRGIKIKYISFIPHENSLFEPEVKIEFDTYRSFGRGAVTIDDDE